MAQWLIVCVVLLIGCGAGPNASSEDARSDVTASKDATTNTDGLVPLDGPAKDAGPDVEQDGMVKDGGQDSRLDGGGITEDGPPMDSRVEDGGGTEDDGGVPDPSEVAPPQDPTVPSQFASSVSFIYEGPEALQQGVVEGSIAEQRVSIVRGQVLDRSDNGIGGATVSVREHPEWGSTQTRDDGLFDLAANGGEVLTLEFEKEGLLPVQRTVDAQWNEFVFAPDVVMIPADGTSSFVDLSSPAFEAATSSTSTDAAGSRQVTLLFAPGTVATYTNVAGETVSPTTLDVRITEYTVGESGPDAMPGELPSTSAYTFAAALSVDEVTELGVKKDGKDVKYNQPVWLYLDNYLGMPVGTIVPSGYYNDDTGAWIAAGNGIVVKILGDVDADGILDLDINGDTAADDSTTYDAIGLSLAEREKLTELFVEGGELWRVPLWHFSNLDCNYGVGAPEGAGDPNVDDPQGGNGGSGSGGGEDPWAESGSRVNVIGQSLAQDIPIAGTPFSLHYESARQRNRPALKVFLTSDTLHERLRKVSVTLEVAGRRLNASYDQDQLEPNMTHVFEWDGLDAYGRPVYQQVPAQVTVTHEYPGVYTISQLDPDLAALVISLFGQPAFDGTVERPDRPQLFSQSFEVLLGDWIVPEEVLGGWTLDAHHTYDAGGGILHLGNGHRASASALGYVTHTVTGQRGSSSADEGLAEELRVEPSRMAFSPDGTLYILQDRYVKRINQETGTLEIIAGTDSDPGYVAEGMPATSISFGIPSDIAFSPTRLPTTDKNVEFCVAGQNPRVRCVYWDDTDARYEVHELIPRNDGDAFLDGVPLADAVFDDIYALEFAPDGTLFVLDRSLGGYAYSKTAHVPAALVARVGTDGIIYHYAGGGDSQEDGLPGKSYRLEQSSTDLELGPDGSVYVANRACDTIHKIAPDGTVRLFAGGGDPLDGVGDDGPATAAHLAEPWDMEMARNGTLYVVSAGHRRIRVISSDGMITTLIGNGASYWSDTPLDQGILARQLAINNPRTLAFSPEGVLHFDGVNGAIARLTKSFDQEEGSIAYRLSDRSGERLFHFDIFGRHQKTTYVRTGQVIHTFEYTDYADMKLLTRISDGADNTLLSIERDAEGTPTALMTSAGATTLERDDQGYLSAIEDPKRLRHTFTYGTDTAAGLMQTYIDPQAGTHTFSYDSAGRLESDLGPDDRLLTLTRDDADDGYAVTSRNGMSKEATFRVRFDGEDIIREFISYGGFSRTITSRADGTKTAEYPDGSTVRITYSSHPQLGSMAAYASESVYTTPSGRALYLTTTLDVETDPDDTATVLSWQATLNMAEGDASGPTEAGVDYLLTYDVTTGEAVTTSPMGRTFSEILNDVGLRSEYIFDAAYDTLTLNWNSDQTLDVLGDGSWSKAMSYSGGVLTAVENTGMDAVTYGYTGGFHTSTLLPSGRTFAFGYDSAGNLETITVPRLETHVLGYTSNNRLESYTPPGGSNTVSVTYNAEGLVEDVVWPVAGTVTRGYDDQGRIESWTSADSTTAVTFYSDTADPETLTWQEDLADGATRAQTLTYDWDGVALDSLTFSGDADATLTYDYGRAFLLKEITFDDGSASIVDEIVSDDDGRVTAFGPFSQTHTGPAGNPDGISRETMQLALGYDATMVLPATRTLTVDGTTVFASQVTFNTAGLIDTATLEIDNNTNNYAYTYDADGQLETVVYQGATVENYDYDLNGNRTNRTRSGTATSYGYDATDRLTSVDSDVVSIDGDGKLETFGSNSYVYGARGELHSATVSGTTVTYTYDGYLRRVAHHDSDGTTQYFYGEHRAPLRLTHSKSPDGTVSRYYYDGHGALVAFLRGSSWYYVGSDWRGTPWAIFDDQGNLVKQINYDSFGDRLDDSDPSFDLPVGFAGGLFDTHSGFVRFGMRDYDPETGRFTTRDPGLFSSLGLQLYAYCRNDPINKVDPSGVDEIGFAGYIGYGAGASFSWDDWFSHASVCLETGFGVGGGVEYSLQADSAGNRNDLIVAAQAGCGPIQIGYEGTLDDCGVWTNNPYFELGDLQVDLNGIKFDHDEIEAEMEVNTKHGKLKCTGQIKLAAKVCRELW